MLSTNEWGPQHGRIGKQQQVPTHSPLESLDSARIR